jgi:hypothetical protein
MRTTACECTQHMPGSNAASSSKLIDRGSGNPLAAAAAAELSSSSSCKLVYRGGGNPAHNSQQQQVEVHTTGIPV